MLPLSAAIDAELERALAMRVQGGDIEAFEQLYHAYYNLLVRLAVQYLRSRDAAEDIVQDAFVRYWDDRAQWDDRGSVRAYLQIAVRRRALNVLDRRQSQAMWHATFEAEERSPATGHAGLAPGHALETDERNRLIADAISALPARARSIAIMKWYEELGRTDIARELGISVRTVDAQLINIQKAIRARLIKTLR